MVRAIKMNPLEDGTGAVHCMQPAKGCHSKAAAGAAPGPRSFGGSSTGSGWPLKQVPSLVFELEDLADVRQHPTADDLEESTAERVKQMIAALLEPWSEPEYMLLLHVRFAREEAAKRGQPLVLAETLAETLRRLGYSHVTMRTALGGGNGGACLRSLRHSFLTVSVSTPSGSMSYIVDPRFRDQFEIAHATQRYASVLEAVGSEVVTTQDRLTKVVEILCSEMALAFQVTGTPLPPWRQQAAMLSKWMPGRCEEVDLSLLKNGAAPDGMPGAVPKRLTGPDTIAERLVMLGVMQQQPTADSFDQSLAAVEEEEGWEALDGYTSSTGSSPRGESAAQQPVSTAVQSQAPVAVPPRRSTPDTPASPHGSPVQQPHANVFSILNDMRARAATLPHRRSTWAG